MTPHDFVRKWKPVTLTEMSAYQQHFLDLCEMLGERKPADVDPTGESFTFQKGVTKSNDKKGWADVWRKGCFGWEYKGKHKDLNAAYAQLLQYREALFNPPLLIVCDLDRFEIHTNFLNTAKRVYKFDLDTLPDPKNLALLRSAFKAPSDLDPGRTRQQVTEDIAERFAELTNSLQRRQPPEEVARFLIKLMFCMFAQSVDLLPDGLFTKVLTSAKGEPAALSKRLRTLFNCMAKGEPFGEYEIRWFNGGLFADCQVLDLEAPEIRELIQCAVFDWGEVEPTIFGTLFERALDPDKRAQIGAHYTGRADIETVLQAVVIDPLRREWNGTRARADALWAQLQEKNRKAATQKERGPVKKLRTAFDECVQGFYRRLTEVTILDPACGSGNFLYLSLHLLLDLEKEAWRYGNEHGLSYIPQVSPDQLRGLEVNTYARELAQVVVWIGYLQWNKHNGFRGPENPVLDSMEAIVRKDAILDLSDPAHPKEPSWPDAEFIVGNPPFLGGKMLRANLGDGYVDALFKLYGERIPNFSDLCCYWFEKARAQVETGRTKRVGLLATQGIRGGANREVLNRIKETGDIFFAVSDREWVLDGANVHISIVGFDNGTEGARALDCEPVSTINSNLTATADTTKARRLTANRGVGYIADVKAGKFDIPAREALPLLEQPNPHGRPNSDVLRPWVNGLDITRRARDYWIIDFGADMRLQDAQMYEEPLKLVRTRVKPKRDLVKRPAYRDYWWLHAEPCEVMRKKIEPLDRFLATITTSKYRLFVWMCPATLPDHQLVAFARSDDYFFGLMHSRAHEVWGLRMGTRLEDRPRYTPTTCFETFPFPEPFAAHEAEIGKAAKKLNALRERWLNPPEWTRTETLEFPGSVDGPWKRYIAAEDVGDGVGTVRYPRTVPKNEECAVRLKARTLTNLYNERPAWLDHAHRELDELVLAAYGLQPGITDEELLAKLLELNLSMRADGNAVLEPDDEELAAAHE